MNNSAMNKLKHCAVGFLKGGAMVVFLLLAMSLVESI